MLNYHPWISEALESLSASGLRHICLVDDTILEKQHQQQDFALRMNYQHKEHIASALADYLCSLSTFLTVDAIIEVPKLCVSHY